MKYFSDIYKQALVSLKSVTMAELTDKDLTEVLDTMLIRSIAAFRFPRVDLTYSIANPDTENVGYYFVEDITQHEINVMLVLMKELWLEQQLDDEKMFEQKYYDASIRTHSQANMLAKLKERYELAVERSEKAQYDYGRVDNYVTRIGDIYE